MDSNLNILSTLRSFYTASERVTRTEFELFVTTGLMREPMAVQAVGWAPKIAAAEVQAFEQSQRSHGVPEYRVHDRDAAGKWLAPQARDTYFPLAYIVPYRGNETALGYDVTSETVRRDAIERALRSRQAAATARIRLVQDAEHDSGTIIYLPIYADQNVAPGDTTALLGIASAVIRLDRLGQATLASIVDIGLRVRVFDRTNAGKDIELLAMGFGQETPNAAVAHSLDIPIRVADRAWVVRFDLPADYLVAHRSWQAWGLLAAGLALTALLGILLLVLLAQQSKIEQLVDKRTAELRRTAAELERSNRELEQFAYVASHDLQAPVRGALSFAQLLRQRYAGKVLEGKGLEFLHHIEDSGRHMEELIKGLLTLSRVGRAGSDDAVANCETALTQVIDQLAGVIAELAAAITHDPLPVVRAAQIEIFQLLQNLIMNGLKFQPGPAPRVHLSAVREGAMWHLSVRDHGIGIAAAHQERIFRIFQRLHSGTQFEGTGIGLAICQKIVNGRGGRIWVESTPGAGAVFHFTLPVAEST
ncbi:MAG: sensor histidine kinase [Panacagrimonas sp.]